jgi:chromosome segregation ATPase
MKEMIALIVFVVVAATTIFLAVRKKISGKLAALLLGFSIVAGYAIANYDIIQLIKWGNFEVQTAKKEISEAKQSALADISNEVKGQKESIRLLLTSVNDTREKLEEQKRALAGIVNTATELQKKIEEQKNVVLTLNNDARRTRDEIRKLNDASGQIALIMVKANYLTLSTKNEFGGLRSQKAIQEIENDINRLLPLVIPDSQQRAKWIQDLQTILPARQ